MEKVELTKDQAMELQAFKNLGHSLEDWVNQKNDTREPYSIIHALSLDEMAKVLYLEDAYEIIGPKFEPGDKVVLWSKIVTLKERRMLAGRFHWNIEEMSDVGLDESCLIRPTPEEIYWLHDLGRDCVNDFRIGDIFIYTHGTTYRLADNIEDDTEDTATIHDAIRWAENGNMVGIYPAEQFKPFKGEE